MRDHPTAREAIEAMLRDNAAAYTDPERPDGCLVVQSAASCSPGNTRVRERLAAVRRSVQASIAGRVQRGIAAGDVPAGADAAAVAAFYHTVLEGLSHRARLGVSHEDLQSIIDSAMAAWPAVTAPRP